MHIRAVMEIDQMRSERVKIPQKTAKEYIKPYHEYDDTGINFYIEKIASLMMFCIFFFFLGIIKTRSLFTFWNKFIEIFIIFKNMFM